MSDLLCSIPDCTKPRETRGWCLMHYYRWYRHGDPTKPSRLKRPPGMPLAEWILQRSVRTDSGCLEWQGWRDTHGYGGINRIGEQRRIGTHRAIWEAVNGPIPDRLHVLHRCDNPPCCEVEHLFLGTAKVNAGDKAAKGRAPRGEAHYATTLTEDDVYAIFDAYHALGLTQVTIGKLFDVHNVTVSQILRGVRWAYLHDEATVE